VTLLKDKKILSIIRKLIYQKREQSLNLGKNSINQLTAKRAHLIKLTMFYIISLFWENYLYFVKLKFKYAGRIKKKQMKKRAKEFVNAVGNANDNDIGKEQNRKN